MAVGCFEDIIFPQCSDNSGGKRFFRILFSHNVRKIRTGSGFNVGTIRAGSCIEVSDSQEYHVRKVPSPIYQILLTLCSSSLAWIAARKSSLGGGSSSNKP